MDSLPRKIKVQGGSLRSERPDQFGCGGESAGFDRDGVWTDLYFDLPAHPVVPAQDTHPPILSDQNLGAQREPRTEYPLAFALGVPPRLEELPPPIGVRGGELFGSVHVGFNVVERYRWYGIETHSRTCSETHAGSNP